MNPKFVNRMNAINRFVVQIQGNADGISKQIELRYGIPGGYTDSEIKEIAESLISINNRLLNIRRRLS